MQRRRVALRSGIEIALLDFGGRGPLVLAHHANGFCGAVFGPVAEALGADHHVVALDARGHGDSSKPEDRAAYRWERFVDDLIGVAEALVRDAPSGRVALAIGHSFGGTASLGAAARQPELFERLLLVDPVIVPPVEQAAPERSARVGELADAARRRQSVRPSRAAARAHLASRSFFSDWDPKALDLYVAEGMRERPDGQVELKCPGEVEATIFEGSGMLDVFALAPRVVAPVRILWAERGDFPRSVYEALATHIGDAEVIDVPTGHLVPMERPDLVAREARELLARPAAARAASGTG